MNQEKYWLDFFNKKAVQKQNHAERLTFSSEANRQSIYSALLSQIEGQFEKVLDAGAGSGEFCILLKNRYKSMIAMDISHNMLKLIQHDHLAFVNNVHLCLGSVAKPPFARCSFNLIIASEVLQCVNFIPIISVLISLLKEDGTLLISIPCKYHPSISQANIRRNGLYNGIGMEELEYLRHIENTTFSLMPLFLADEKEKRYIRGECAHLLEPDKLKRANRFIIKIQKKP